MKLLRIRKGMILKSKSCKLRFKLKKNHSRTRYLILRVIMRKKFKTLKLRFKSLPRKQKKELKKRKLLLKSAPV